MSNSLQQPVLENAPLLDVISGRRPQNIPVWFMRQAGRSLPEYRSAREGIPMLEACFTPELAAELTLQPVKRYGVDAAIFFSDIVVPLVALGLKIDIVAGVGPVFEKPLRTPADIAAIPELQPGQLDKVTQAISFALTELGNTPLIGFTGAPYTLASYLIEGGPSKNHENTKALMYGDETAWNALMSVLARICAEYARLQIAAGVSAVQLFDSWVGSLPLADYVKYVKPHSDFVLKAIKTAGAPRIHFGVTTGELLPAMAEHTDVLGVDFRVPLDTAAQRVGRQTVLQGNLDPAFVFAPKEALLSRVDQIIHQGSAAAGHIFNLGHGVIPSSNPDALKRVVDRVHETEVPEYYVADQV